MAIQAFNEYRNDGQFVCFIDAVPRAAKEKDCNLSSDNSCYVSAEIFNSKEQIGVKAFFDSGDIGYLNRKLNAIMSRPAINQNKPNTPAYSLRFPTGAFKGMTAAEVLQNPANNAGINDYYQQLKANADKYKGNTSYMAAIVEALNAKNAGTLVAVTQIPPEVILEELKTPNNKKVDDKGNTEVRILNITYNAGSEKPYVITITNGMAPPAQGLVGARVSQMVDKKVMSMDFTEKSFANIIDAMLDAKTLYANGTANSRLQKARTAFFEDYKQR